MAVYIKVNKKVGEFIGAKLLNRRTYPDGNWCLWLNDMLAFGPLYDLNNTLARVGGVKLTPMQNKEEFLGVRTTILPLPQDPIFVDLPEIEEPEVEELEDMEEYEEEEEEETQEKVEEVEQTETEEEE